MTTDPYIHRETEDIRRKMFDPDVVSVLLARLENDEYPSVRLATIETVRELAKIGKFREQHQMRIFTMKQTISVARCWIPMLPRCFKPSLETNIF